MSKTSKTAETYVLDDQVGFLLRKANQRHTAIFAKRIIDDLTPTQFAAMVRLYHAGEVSQNQLGRAIAVDGATIKGVIDRLRDRGIVQDRRDARDRRRILLKLTEKGSSLAEKAIALGAEITAETLKPLTSLEQKRLCELLAKIS